MYILCIYDIYIYTLGFCWLLVPNTSYLFTGRLDNRWKSVDYDRIFWVDEDVGIPFACSKESPRFLFLSHSNNTSWLMGGGGVGYLPPSYLYRSGLGHGCTIYSNIWDSESTERPWMNMLIWCVIYVVNIENGSIAMQYKRSDYWQSRRKW